MARGIKNLGTELFDMDMARRLYSYRYEFVDKKQKIAAEKLGVSASYLSYAESGQRQINYDLVDKLAIDYDMNREWFATGLGERKVTGREKPTASASLQAVHTNVLNIMKTIKILEKNLGQAYKIIERQQKQIDELSNRIK